MPGKGTLNLEAELLHYGVNCRSGDVHFFDGKESSEHLDYLDLIEMEGSPDGGAAYLQPDGVAENQNRPLLFFVNETRLAKPSAALEAQLGALRRNLACRGDRAYLARIRPGELLVVPVSLDERTPEWRPFSAGTPEALTFFSRLALGRVDGLATPDDADFVFNEMFHLLNCGIERITRRIGWADVLSLVGRALFFRFLCDRNIVGPEYAQRIAPGAQELEACFDDWQKTYATCQWLDKTFNGEFLPLSRRGSRAFFEDIDSKARTVFKHLSAIVRGLEPVGSEDYQRKLKLKWSDFDFAHIPVGLLSQVYERFCWKWDKTAGETSVHYTPRNIAATLVDEAFERLPAAHKARVLDPACGAGVFLVLALRRLYRERWEADKKRPNTTVIRELLNRQITGFDISESALRLAALSLYLTAIELDPQPVPPERLRFKELNGLVLFNHRHARRDPETGAVIGSLGTHVDADFDGKFQVVLSNPPWKSISPKGKSLADEMNTVSRAIISRHDQKRGAAYSNPDSVPDLPFLWKATQWCAPGGRIAMALPARLLFKQGDISRTVRETVFRLIEVSAIVNCSNLRKTNVWPDMDQPFMLLFARNRRPRAGHLLHFISPHTDLLLNGLGEVRIDSKSGVPVDVEATFAEPWLWKALAVGTSLDIGVVQKVRAAGGRELHEYWRKDLKCVSSNGYKIEADQIQHNAKPLKKLRNLNSTALFSFGVELGKLDFFDRDTAARPRLREDKDDELRVYRGPLALVKEAPGPDRTKGWALLCRDDVAYNQSFYGYSGAGHKDGELLVRYLQLFVHSQLWLHYALLTSPKLGFERPNVYKADLDECPFIPLERLADDQRREVIALSKRLLREDATVFEEIDSLFGKLYGLDERDVEVIRDTLTIREPNDELGRRASVPPTGPESTLFRRRLESALRPFFKALDKEPHVTMWKLPGAGAAFDAPFAVLLIGERDGLISVPEEVFQTAVLPLANETGSSRIIQQVEGGLLIGLLRQYRYWTPSQARLLGSEILRHHMAIFES